MDPVTTSAIAWLYALIPLCFVIPALRVRTADLSAVRQEWRLPSAAACLALILAVILALVPVAPQSVHLLAAPGEGMHSLIQLSIRIDLLTRLMLVLVSFIAWVILRYSRHYLAGDRGQPRYLRALLLTLAAVVMLITTNNLLVLAFAWIMTGVGLHSLLTYYGERAPARLAARKKFVLSRLADILLLLALVLIAGSLHTLEINEIQARLAGLDAVPAAVTASAVLIALAAILKCAQLPFHGWLIQVMEAPTPVSALLHAGIVNIGGFVLIRLAALISTSNAAEWLLVVVGSLTAVIAALVMTTRISIKVKLAWSTCAQMGFMLLQCGLGAYELALLHLLAHSLYKAHAFLSSGSTVAAQRIADLSPPAHRAGFVARLLSGALSVGLVLMLLHAIHRNEGVADASAVLAVVLALSLPQLALAGGKGIRARIAMLGVAAGVTLLYGFWHQLFEGRLALGMPADLDGLRMTIPLALFGTLFVLQSWLAAHPQGRLARALYPHVFAGFYLDEIYTRLVARFWPLARRPQPQSTSLPLATPELPT